MIISYTGVLGDPKKTNGGTKAPPYEHDYNLPHTVGTDVLDGPLFAPLGPKEKAVIVICFYISIC